MLQFDVLQFRLRSEYNVEIILENLPYEYIRWVDNEDVDKVKHIKWNYSHGYANCRNRKIKSLMMHRRILDTDQFVDHINHNTLDNRKCNLRIVNKSQNQMNSNYKGVCVRKDGRFTAHIKRHGLMVNLKKNQ